MKYLKRFEEYEYAGSILVIRDGEKIEDYLPLKDSTTQISASLIPIKELPILDKDNIDVLILNGCGLEKIEKLPSKLKRLVVHTNNLTELPELPETLDSLLCFNNKLTALPKIPKNVHQLTCYKNDWKEPINYDVYKKLGLDPTVYTEEQIEKFKTYDFQKEFIINNPEKINDLKPFKFHSRLETFEFQKEFLENNPSRYMDILLIGDGEYVYGIKELFPEIFSAHDLGL